MGQVAATTLHTDGPTNAQAVGVDEGKMVAAVYLVKQNVAGREVAVQETLFVKTGRKTGKLSHHRFALFG